MLPMNKLILVLLTHLFLIGGCRKIEQKSHYVIESNEEGDVECYSINFSLDISITNKLEYKYIYGDSLAIYTYTIEKNETSENYLVSFHSKRKNYDFKTELKLLGAVDIYINSSKMTVLVFSSFNLLRFCKSIHYYNISYGFFRNDFCLSRSAILQTNEDSTNRTIISLCLGLNRTWAGQYLKEQGKRSENE